MTVGLLAIIEGNWLNYPGFEAWRFVNLFLFIGGALYLHHRFGKPITQALRTRAATIKVELEDAKRRKDLAEAELKEVEGRLGQVGEQVAKIRTEAEVEAAAESERIQRSTELEKTRIRSQGEREIANIIKTAQVEVRRFTVAKGVERAESLLRQELDASRDARLIGISADQFGGRQH